MTRIVLAAAGSEYRRDDGAGLAAARRVVDRRAALDRPGAPEIEVLSVHDPLDLLGRWDGADLAVVLDATRSGTPAGTVRTLRLDGAAAGAAGAALRTATTARGSTHGIGIGEVLRLSRTLACAPRCVVVVGIEGEDFGHGEGLSPAVMGGVEAAAERVLALVEEACRCA